MAKIYLHTDGQRHGFRERTEFTVTIFGLKFLFIYEPDQLPGRVKKQVALADTWNRAIVVLHSDIINVDEAEQQAKGEVLYDESVPGRTLKEFRNVNEFSRSIFKTLLSEHKQVWISHVSNANQQDLF